MKSWKDYLDEANQTSPNIQKPKKVLTWNDYKQQAKVVPIKNKTSSPAPSKQKMIDLQNQVFSQSEPQTVNKPWYEDMFGKTPYTELYKQGDIAGGTANLIGSGLQGIQSLYLNWLNNMDKNATEYFQSGGDVSKITPNTFTYNMDKATYDQQTAQRRGGQTIQDYANKAGPVVGGIVSFANEALSDPSELLPFGMYDDITKGIKAGQAGSVNNIRQMAENVQEQFAKAPVRIPNPISAPNVETNLESLARRLPPAPTTLPERSIPLDINKVDNISAPAPIPKVEAKNLDELVQKYGAFPKGEPYRAREIAVPKATDFGKTSRFGRTAIESAAISDDAAQAVMDDIKAGKFVYTPISNKNSLENASKVLANGMDEALTRWDAVVNGTKKADKYDIALAESIIKQASDEGNAKLVTKVVAELSAESSQYGQNIQALRMLKQMTPAGQLLGVQKFIDKTNKTLRSKLGSKFNDIVLDENSPAIKQLLSSTTKEETEKAMDVILTDVAKQIPSSWVDKWNAWRYMSMLGNPKTHIRNFFGNAIMVPAREIKTIIGTGLEKGLPQAERTKSILTPKDKSLIDFAKVDFKDIESVLKSGGKLNASNIIQDNRTIFKTKWLEWCRKKNLKLMDKTDTLFLNVSYSNSLAQAAKARGYTVDFLTSGSKESKEALESIRLVAFDEALKATYRDASTLSKAITNLKRAASKYKATEVLAEGLIPFTKTPANVLQRGIDYSPAGIIEGIYDLTQIKSGKKTAQEAIDHVASGLTGSGIVVLGAYLASQGIITGGSNDNQKAEQFESLQGEQNYAITIGDQNYTIDWMAPISLPLFVGVEAWRALQTENLWLVLRSLPIT